MAHSSRGYMRSYMREYRLRRREKIKKLKQLASGHHTLTRSQELADLIRELFGD